MAASTYVLPLLESLVSSKPNHSATTTPDEAEDFVFINSEDVLRKLAEEKIDFYQFSQLDPSLKETLTLIEQPEENNNWELDSFEISTSSLHLSEKEEPIPPLPEPLHITCLTIGTRGDVQPFVALCKGLQEAGHKCRIASHAEYQSFVESHGIEFRPVGGNPADLIQLCVNNGMFSISFIREGVAKFSGFIQDLLETAWKACEGTQVLIGTPSSMAGFHIAEKLQIPFIYGFPFPWTKTKYFPHPFSGGETELGRRLTSSFNYLTKGGLNYFTYLAIDKVLWVGISHYVNSWRVKTLELKPINFYDDSKVPMLYAYSSYLAPAPSDWNPWVHVTGYWFLDRPTADWTPSDKFVKFLEEDTPKKLVYIGFGSIVVDDPDAFTQIIIDSIEKANVRAILAKGWISRSKDDQPEGSEKEKEKEKEKRKEIVWPDSIYLVSQAPHDWLFPRVDGVVHHGGAGTTAAGLRAGCPTLIKPFFGDQYFWGQKIEELGVGSCLHALTVDSLSEALISLTNDVEMKKRATELAEKIQNENGIQNAIRFFNKHVGEQLQDIQKNNPCKFKDEEFGFVCVDYED